MDELRLSCDKPRIPASDRKWWDVGVRTLWAAILIPCVLLPTWLGGLWFVGLVAFSVVVMADEWCRLVFLPRATLQRLLHIMAGLTGAFLPLLASMVVVCFSLVLLWGLSVTLLLCERCKDGSHRHDRYRGGVWGFLGIAYIGVFALSMIVLRSYTPQGLSVVIWLFAIVWITDSAAYFCGRLIGGVGFAPRISPAKTWAGAAGGLVAACIAPVVVAAFKGATVSTALIVVAGILSIASQAGDLIESALKRSVKVKDSGSLIPGHGGMLDRVDGLVAAAIVAMVITIAQGGLVPAATGPIVW